MLNYHNLLEERASCKESTLGHSWGAHLILTFDELTRQKYDWEKNEDVYARDGGNFKKSRKSRKETLFINASNELQMVYENPEDARAFITDRNCKSLLMPDLSSHLGKQFIMQNYLNHHMDVKIQIKSLWKKLCIYSLTRKFL